MQCILDHYSIFIYNMICPNITYKTYTIQHNPLNKSVRMKIKWRLWTEVSYYLNAHHQWTDMSAFVCWVILGGADFVSLPTFDFSQLPLLLRPRTWSLDFGVTGLLVASFLLPRLWRCGREQHTSGDELIASPELFLLVVSFGDLGRVSGSCHENRERH